MACVGADHKPEKRLAMIAKYESAKCNAETSLPETLDSEQVEFEIVNKYF